MRSLGWTLVQYDRCPYKGGIWTQRQTGTEGRQRRDSERSQPGISARIGSFPHGLRRKQPYDTRALLASELRDTFLLLKPLSVWHLWQLQPMNAGPQTSEREVFLPVDGPPVRAGTALHRSRRAWGSLRPPGGLGQESSYFNWNKRPTMIGNIDGKVGTVDQKGVCPNGQGRGVNVGK